MRAVTIMSVQRRIGLGLDVAGEADAVELAAIRGVRPLVAASPEDESLVRRLGATDFISREADLPADTHQLVSGGVDAVIDAACLAHR